MWKYIWNKTILSFFAALLVFFMFYILYVSVKGNPFIGKTLEPKVYNAKIKAYNIDKSSIERFGIWVRDFFNGNFGDIYNMKGANKNIAELVFTPLKKSMLVAIPSFLIGMFFGLTLGFIAGYKRNTIIDVFINGFVTFFISIPSFIMAAFAIIIGPSLGLPTIFQNSEIFGTSQMIQSIILPIIVLSLVSLSGWASLSRIEVSKILTSDYITAARTKGYSEFKIFRKYVFRNSIYPFAGAIATSFTVVFGSSIIVEKFFNVDGTSTLILNASINGEINILMFNLVIIASIGLFSQIIADVTQYSVSPIVKSLFSSQVSPITKMKFYINKFKMNSKNKGQEVKND